MYAARPPLGIRTGRPGLRPRHPERAAPRNARAAGDRRGWGAALRGRRRPPRHLLIFLGDGLRSRNDAGDVRILTGGERGPLRLFLLALFAARLLLLAP